MKMGIRTREDLLTERIIACAIAVHQQLGNVYPEKFYKRAMMLEMTKQGLCFEVEKQFEVFYNGKKIGEHHIDLIIEHEVVLELKTVSALGKEQYTQVRSYLKATGLETGLLINFSGGRADYRRITLPAA